MPGPDYLPAPPPEVPEEFSAAYREAYLRALADAGPEVAEEPGRRPSRARRSWEDWRRERWFLPAVVAAGALVLVAGAYAVGVALSGNAPAGDRPARQGQLAGSPADSSQPEDGSGSLQPVSVSAIAADCTAAPSTDSAGRSVTYVPQNAIDTRTDTAWRCTGSGLGQKLVLRLAGDVPVSRVGLVPGYAKTDPASGVDRYAENNRITRVRWTLADGVQVVQRLDPDPSSRAMQVLRVPPTTTDTVVLEILAVQRGPRGTTAISSIGLWAAR